MEEKVIAYCANETNISPKQVKNVLTLLIDQGCSVPFVARYRKEITQNLDETQIRNIEETYNQYLEIEKRRQFILQTLEKLDVLTKELKENILKAKDLNQLEDLYAPYKSKKKTKAQLAREMGLTPLAEALLTSLKKLDELEKEFVPLEGVLDFKAALEGAGHIVMEIIAHNLELKECLREAYWNYGVVVSTLRKKGEEVTDYLKFQDFFDFNEPLTSLIKDKSSHRFLALRRGMTNKILRVEVTFDQEMALQTIKEHFYPIPSKLGAIDHLKELALKAYTNFIHPSLDLEIKTELKQKADLAAIKVFDVNLRNLLLSPYLGAKAVMGIDPGVRTGCKVVIVDNTGKLLVDFVVYPHASQREIKNAKDHLDKTLEHFKVFHVAVGDGTYGRETLQFLSENIDLIKDGKVKATLISETGASIYSASDVARKEFPEKDLTVRGAVSIARRFQDPLAELVKIDPKSLGVGQYQHDVNQTKLKKSLTTVVESCVNYVGVDLNTASSPLLSYISGIGPKLAENIVAYRQKKGNFSNREQLLEVSRFKDKSYQQACGFLRIYNGDNPLDSTFVHPERYPTLSSWCEEKNILLHDLVKEKKNIESMSNDKKLKETIGEHTFKDILDSLKAPVQDPRTVFKSIEFDQKLKSFQDLVVGKWYTGTITNITQFGAFVNIGLKENGLVHISQISDSYVENPLDVLKVGQEIEVRVLSLDQTRKRIGLSCKKGPSKQRPPPNLTNSPFAALKNFKI